MAKHIAIILFLLCSYSLFGVGKERTLKSINIDGKTLVYKLGEGGASLMYISIKEEDRWRDSLLVHQRKRNYRPNASVTSDRNKYITSNIVGSTFPNERLSRFFLEFVIEKDSVRAVKYIINARDSAKVSPEEILRIDSLLKKNYYIEKIPQYEDLIFSDVTIPLWGYWLWENPLLETIHDIIVKEVPTGNKTMVFSKGNQNRRATWIWYKEEQKSLKKFLKKYGPLIDKKYLSSSYLKEKDKFTNLRKSVREVFSSEKMKELKGIEISYFFITHKGKIITSYYLIDDKYLDKITAEEMDKLDRALRANWQYPFDNKVPDGCQGGSFTYSDFK